MMKSCYLPFLSRVASNIGSRRGFGGGGRSLARNKFQDSKISVVKENVHTTGASTALWQIYLNSGCFNLEMSPPPWEKIYLQYMMIYRTYSTTLYYAAFYPASQNKKEEDSGGSGKLMTLCSFPPLLKVLCRYDTITHNWVKDHPKLWPYFFF